MNFVERSKTRRTLRAAGFTEAKAKTIVDFTLASIIRDDQWSTARKARKARRTLTAASFTKVKVEAIVDSMFEDPDLPYRANRYLLENAGFDKAQAESIVDVLTEYLHNIHSRTLNDTFSQRDAETILDALFAHGLQSEYKEPGYEGTNARYHLRNYGFDKAQAEALVDALCLSTYGHKADWTTSGFHRFPDKTDRVREARRILIATGFKEDQVQSLVGVLFEDHKESYYRHLKEAGFDESQTKTIVDLLQNVYSAIQKNDPLPTAFYFWFAICLILLYSLTKWIW